MDARTYYSQHGKATCISVAEAAKTNWPYFKQIVYGVRTPSKGLARKLVEVSSKQTPGESLTFEKLLFPPKRAPRKSPAKPKQAARRCG